ILFPTNDTTVCPLDTMLLRGRGIGGMPYMKAPNYKFEWRSVDDNVVLSTSNPYKWGADKSIHLRLHVKDSIGCTSSDEVRINVNSFKIMGGQNDTTICLGTSFRAAPVVASGSSSYQYSWDQSSPLLDDPTIVSPVLSPFDTASPTKYVLTVTDNFGCTLTDEVNIRVGSLPTVSIQAANDFCQGQTYTLHSQVSGGKQPYTYSWFEPQGQTLGFAPSDTSGVRFTPNKAGSAYVIQLKVVDSNKCESSNAAAHMLQVYQSPVVNFGSDTVICNGQTLIQSAEFPENSGLNLNYAWFRDNVLLANVTSTQLLDVAGLYKAVLTSEMGCMGMDSISVAVKDSIYDLELRTSDAVCKGQEVKVYVNIVQGTPDYHVKWSTDGAGNLVPAESTLSNSQDSTLYSSIATDGDSVGFTVQVSNACNIRTKTIRKALNPAPTAVISSPTAPTVYINQLVEFTQSSINYDLLTWNFGDKSPLLQSNDIKVSHTYTEGDVFDVILLAETHQGCKHTDVLKVVVINNQNIFIPNVFNPSSVNPENSTIKVYGVNISNSGFSFVVFNRWGQVVYETADYTQATKSGWNGKMNNSGEDLSLGSYTYLVKGKYGDGKEFEKVGTITLVK
ncbi:MAG TPA: gliding motility-associated C-terminal domain-containing protein, partial [Cytophagales bacterium]|nr:gliding motility-associated C-terminal domain-containing protein [Cytophagales bacterium]